MSWGMGRAGLFQTSEAPCCSAGPEAGGCGSRGSCPRMGKAAPGGTARGKDRGVTEAQSGRGERACPAWPPVCACRQVGAGIVTGI